MKLAVTTLCLFLSAFLSSSAGPEVRAHCNLGALTSADRARDKELLPVLAGALRERKELPEGYAYRFDVRIVKELGEWIGIESKCCQPLEYQLVLESQPGGALWVRITGHEAKEFIGAEFAPLSQKLASQDRQ